MPNYIRAREDGGTFFFTVVTERRQCILTDEPARLILSEAIRETLAERPVIVRAMVLLPDHLHAILSLPAGDADYSTRWSVIKRRFADRYLAAGGAEQPRSESRKANRRRGVWQRRFWEHLVRADEFEAIAAYLHLNPVKHGLSNCPHAWPWSTFGNWVADGRLRADWECVLKAHASGEPFRRGLIDVNEGTVRSVLRTLRDYLRSVLAKIATTPISELDQFLSEKWKAEDASVG